MLKKHLFLSLLMAVSTATVSAETHHAHLVVEQIPMLMV